MSKHPIPVTKSSMPPYAEYIEEIKELWETRWLTNAGPKHQELEKGLREYLEVENIALFANGHLALELAINALELKGEVITTPFTFASTTQAIVRNGLTPVFCDIDENNYTIDASRIEKLITEKTSAIMPVHVYGNICDVYAIESIAKKYGLKVIYDAAHTFGVKVDGKAVGNFGDISMFSFHATKVFHTVEGGGLTYKDAGLTPVFAKLRQFGMVGQESVTAVGTNAKMTEMHAAMGLCNLRHVDEEIAKRGKAAQRYREALKGVAGIKICQPQENIKPNNAYFPIIVNKQEFGINRDELLNRLAEENIFTRKYFYPLTSDFEVYRGLFEIQPTPVAKEIADSVLALPLYADLSSDDVEKICELIRRQQSL